ncbi:topology modulation protein [Marinilactibacillus kalidii]|uniref:topology modulation protein n=1 Tax=Marinilactibacillus kalidii TaxID=2820274 RepID=UPI001ABED9D6|nr:topology modulation protein [Marinilactibacillus kalidii]
MKRITIVGPSGSGKSTLAKQLGQIFDLPVFHMDQLFFDPGWVEKSKETLLEEVKQILDKNDQWIIEGNYGKTLPTRLSQSTQVIFLDYPRRIYFYRVLKRVVTTLGSVREDMAPGCPEKIDLPFLKYVWNFKTARREKLVKLIQSELPDDCELIVFEHPKACEQYFKNIKES